MKTVIDRLIQLRNTIIFLKIINKDKTAELARMIMSDILAKRTIIL